MAGTMFERYGGFASLSKVVMTFYDRLLDSDALARHFEHVDLRRLIDHQTKFIASVMGGPASFSNEHLERVHARLGISGEELDEMIGVLTSTLRDFGVEEKDIDTVVAELRARARHIVTQ